MTLPRHRGHTTGRLRGSRHFQSSLPAVPASHLRLSARNPGTKHAAAFGASLALALMISCSLAHAESSAVRSAREEAARVPFAAFVAEASQRFGIRHPGFTPSCTRKASTMCARFHLKAPWA